MSEPDTDNGPDAPIECEIVPENKDDAYPWTQDADEIRRCFVFEHMANADIRSDVFIANLDAAYRWIKDGTIDKPAGRPSRGGHLKIATE